MFTDEENKESVNFDRISFQDFMAIIMNTGNDIAEKRNEVIKKDENNEEVKLG